jgi:hypothetical protein
MTVELISITISVISVFAALISVAIAQKANKTAEKIYSVDLIGQIFDLYRADTMLHSIQLTWENYRQAWKEIDDNSEQSERKVNSGVPIPYNVAENIVNSYLGKKEDSPEWIAFHEVIAFWKYIAVLVSEKAIDELYVSAFTSPEILGFLYPFEIAYCEKKRAKLHSKTSLETLFKSFLSKNLIRPIE